MSYEKGEEREELIGTILVQTHKAAQIDFGEGKVEWMPYSQCSEEVREYDIGDEILFTAPRWLIDKKELEDHVL